MQTTRSITSSEAKAGLGDLLGSLVAQGPVAITRNGRKIAVLSAPAAPETAVDSNRLAELAAMYAAGKLAWREIAAETGVSFGDLLAELGRQGLQLPRVTPTKRPEQVALFNAILQQAARR